MQWFATQFLDLKEQLQVGRLTEDGPGTKSTPTMQERNYWYSSEWEYHAKIGKFELYFTCAWILLDDTKLKCRIPVRWWGTQR
jgi:hypothetical protein